MNKALELQDSLETLRKKTQRERLAFLKRLHDLSDDDVHLLENNLYRDFSYANQLIENAIGYFPLPLGIVENFFVNDKFYTLPLAIEETSVIAALNKTVLWLKKQNATITSHKKSSLKIGQIQIPILGNLKRIKNFIREQQTKLIQLCHEGPAQGMFERGGGIHKITIRTLPRPDEKVMGIIHIYVDTCNAMGANLINQICEFLKPILEKHLAEEIGLCILSNLNDEDIVETIIAIPDMDSSIAKKIEEASLFAQLDPYRAATNNKGMMNSIDALLIATGNDWRAVEAGLHAFANQGGQYQSLTQWYLQDNKLIGTFKGPMSVGSTGGAIKVHPMAQLMFKILNIHSSRELAELASAVGLVQNLAALRALTSHGIVKGHMTLHIKNMLMALGVTESERFMMEPKMRKLLYEKGYITLRDAQQILDSLRLQNHA